MPPPFENKYKKSTVKTDKDCWTCRKTTTTCLLTDYYASGGDFLYTCLAHLKDPNFATPIETEATPDKTPSVAQEEIDAAIKEYEERKKAKTSATDSEDKDKESKKFEQTKIAKEPAKASQPSSPPPPPEPTHYKLHKSFFDMRLRLHQQRQQQKEVQARRSQLSFPSAPSARPGASASAGKPAA